MKCAAVLTSNSTSCKPLGASAEASHSRPDRSGAAQANSASCSAELADLMIRYDRMVRAVAFRLGGPAAAGVSDDILQQVFLDVWKQLRIGRQIEHPSSYIYRSAVREAIRTLRRERRHGAGTDDADVLERMPDPSPEPIGRIWSREIGATVRAVTARLAPPRATAVRGHLDGLTVRELMVGQNWSYSRARNLIARGMADLRRGLEAQGCRG